MSSANVKDTKPIVAAEQEENKFLESKGCFKIVDAIWPVKFKKRQPGDTGEIFIRTKLRNLIIYIVFLTTISIIVYGMVGVINYYFSVGMLSLFVDSSIRNCGQSKADNTGTWPNPCYTTTFRNGFNDFKDFWQFLQGPLVNGLYTNFETWYDQSNTTDQNLGYIFYQNKLLGEPRIMQIRINNGQCKMAKNFQSSINNCYPPYSSSYQSKDPFGKALQPGFQSNDVTYNAWMFQIDDQGGSYSGLISSYPANGYMITLGKHSSEALAIIQDLESNKWIDLYTRAVIIDFTVYNGNVNLFNQIRLVMEFPSTGGIFNTFTVRTSKLLRYVSGFDFVVLGFECLFLAFIIYYTLEETVDICYNGCKYFKDLYNLIDWVILGLSYATIGLSIYRTIQVNVLLDKLLVSGTSKFENFDNLTYYQEVFNQMSAVVVFITWIKIFKYVALNKTLDQLNLTLTNSAKDLLYFFVMFGIVFIAYAMLGYMLFGELHPDYNTFQKTLFTLFRILLGDFDFIGLRANYPTLGPIYFMTFVFIGFFVLLNMFMGIINSAYTKVKEDLDKKAPEFMLADYLKLNYGRIVDKLSLRRDRILDIQAVLKSDEVSSKDELDFNTWRKELKAKGYADMEIESLFSKYDVDCDRKLNELEKLKLVKDIAKARNNVSKEFKDFKVDHKVQTKKDAFEVGDELGNQNEEEEDIENKKMTRDDFDFIVSRIDRMELSVAGVINKIDRLFGHLENMEAEKMKKRLEIGHLMNFQKSPENDKILYDLAY